MKGGTEGQSHEGENKRNKLMISRVEAEVFCLLDCFWTPTAGFDSFPLSVDFSSLHLNKRNSLLTVTVMLACHSSCTRMNFITGRGEGGGVNSGNCKGLDNLHESVVVENGSTLLPVFNLVFFVMSPSQHEDQWDKGAPCLLLSSKTVSPKKRNKKRKKSS